MPDFVFNIAKGRARTYFELAAAADAIIVVPIETTGIEADDALNNYDDLAALLLATNNEQATMGRKNITTATITIDDTLNRVDVDVADQVWTAATGNAISALLFCYDGDTAAGTDANVVPITKHDFVLSPDGSDVTAQINASGLYRAS